MFLSKRELYFAYGSNMSSNRLIERISSAKVIGPASLDGFIWCCNKLAHDGTARANLMSDDAAVVLGVLFSMKVKQWRRLDQLETGYRRIEVEVEHKGELKKAYTYQSDLLTRQPPSEIYISFIVDGLLEHQMSSEYVSEIRREAGI